MRRLLLNLVVFLGSAAIGLLIAAVVLDNFPSPRRRHRRRGDLRRASTGAVQTHSEPFGSRCGRPRLDLCCATAYEPDIQRSGDQGGGYLDPRNSDRVGCDDARDLGTIALDTTEPGCASPDPLVCRDRLGELRPL